MHSGAPGPRVSVLVVSYRTPALLARALDAIPAADPGGLAEVLVVDNASGDGSAELARAHRAVREVLAWPDNRGFSAGVNAAAALARGHYFLLLNPDVVLPPLAIPRLVERLRALRAGAIGPRQVDEQGFFQLAWGPRPTLVTELARRSAQRRLDRRDVRVARLIDRLARAPRRVAWLAASCLLVRRHAFYAVGGFDERFFLFFEDIDFGLRLRRAGWSSWYDPTLTVVHTRGASAARVPGLAGEAYRRSQAAFWWKHRPGLMAALVGAYAGWRAARLRTKPATPARSSSSLTVSR